MEASATAGSCKKSLARRWEASSQSLLSEESWVSQEGPTLVFQLWSVCPGAVVGGAASVQMWPWAPALGNWRHWPGPLPAVGSQRGAGGLHGTFRSSTTILASHLQCKTTTLFLPVWNYLMFPNTQSTLPLQQHVSCWGFLYSFVLFSLPFIPECPSSPHACCCIVTSCPSLSSA